MGNAVDDDGARSASARRYVMDDDLTARLETVLMVVAETLEFPTVRVNVVDDDRQHTIRLFGTGGTGSVPRSEAFCDTVVRTGHPVIVQDAAHDPRFADFPAVRSGEIGSYLGVPLVGREDLVIGAICTVDSTHRTITSHQLRVLLQFGKIVERQLDLIRTATEEHLAVGAAAGAGRQGGAPSRPLVGLVGGARRPRPGHRFGRPHRTP
ncbi:GAF domain-containing protein [Nakamurella deserti]|uniref:GAF domain-containing protein n=1 Tax=Nakamurella deserti TaxID=2164074 RepID=UPI000DBE2F16|nr:GAF domain-containing protein [Nakamurella deserti]